MYSPGTACNGSGTGTAAFQWLSRLLKAFMLVYERFFSPQVAARWISAALIVLWTSLNACKSEQAGILDSELMS